MKITDRELVGEGVVMIDWDKVPRWANFRTEDKNGEVWYFEDSPLIDEEGGYWYSESGFELFSRIEQAVFVFWEKSLARR